MCDCMAIASKSSVAGDYTVEICYGTEQEVTDYIAALLKDRVDITLSFTKEYLKKMLGEK